MFLFFNYNLEDEYEFMSGKSIKEKNRPTVNTDKHAQQSSLGQEAGYSGVSCGQGCQEQRQL